MSSVDEVAAFVHLLEDHQDVIRSVMRIPAIAAMTASMANSGPAASVAVCVEQAVCIPTPFVHGEALEKPDAGVS